MDELDSFLYFGGLLSNDGRVDSEFSRRIGLASAEFRQIRQVWNHASLSQVQKIKLFQSFVLSKLRYGLCTCWLTSAQRRRLDGFHAQCLQRILRISAAYVSRVPNARVFALAAATPITEQMLRHQLTLLSRVGRSPANDPLRRNCLAKGSANPMIGAYVRRVGRPRHDWTTQFLEEATKMFAVAQLDGAIAVGCFPRRRMSMVQGNVVAGT